MVLGLVVGTAMGCSSADSTSGSGGATGSGGASASGGSTGSGGATTGSGGATTGSGGKAASGGSTGSGGATTGSGGATPGSGGTTGSGGQSASGGAQASGGSGTSSGGAGGARSGGSNGGGGRGTGGSGSGGSGVGGSSPGTGGSGSTTTPKPSAGCSKMTARPSGGQVSVSNEKLYIFPSSYDGTKPFPLIIALHACGNPNTEFVNQFKGTGFDTEYVQAYPNTPDSGQCWSNYSGDISRVLAQYDEVMANYCIDQNRVFATAHSSGAQLLVNIMSHKSDAQHLNFKGIAPVAGGVFNVAVPVPVLYIDGQNDTERQGSAEAAQYVVPKFVSANMCQTTSMPYTAIAACKSVQNGAQVDPGCISYNGCSVPTIWCSHNDPNYSNTEHGIPCFAMKGMYDFFKGLP